jgi:hypothetical protein
VQGVIIAGVHTFLRYWRSHVVVVEGMRRERAIPEEVEDSLISGANHYLEVFAISC